MDKAPLIDGLNTVVYVKPGKPAESFIYRRMSIRDGGFWQMPPISTEEVDVRGVEIIFDWISALPDDLMRVHVVRSQRSARDGMQQ